MRMFPGAGRLWPTLFLMGVWGCATTPVPSAGVPLRSPLPRHAGPLAGAVRTIVIDAGHGGHDPGTSHFGLKEKHLALDIARALRDRLKKEGLRVVLTREADLFIPLSGRPAIANRLRADLFVSVHINANRNSRVSGVEVYYPRVSEVSSASVWPPSVASSEVGIPSMSVRQVLWDMVLGRTRFQSRRLASTICRSMRTGLAVPCRAIKPARFVVLREAWMPSVLVEVGYVTNQQEAGRLANPAYRQDLAQAIAEGIVAYLNELGTHRI